MESAFWWFVWSSPSSVYPKFQVFFVGTKICLSVYSCFHIRDREKTLNVRRTVYVNILCDLVLQGNLVSWYSCIRPKPIRQPVSANVRHEKQTGYRMTNYRQCQVPLDYSRKRVTIYVYVLTRKLQKMKG